MHPHPQILNLLPNWNREGLQVHPRAKLYADQVLLQLKALRWPSASKASKLWKVPEVPKSLKVYSDQMFLELTVYSDQALLQLQVDAVRLPRPSR